MSRANDYFSNFFKDAVVQVYLRFFPLYSPNLTQVKRRRLLKLQLVKSYFFQLPIDVVIKMQFDIYLQVCLNFGMKIYCDRHASTLVHTRKLDVAIAKMSILLTYE